MKKNHLLYFLHLIKYSFGIILLQCFTLSMLWASNESESNKSEKEERVDRIMQTRMISGTVIAGDTGEGLPGVNILEKGTDNGTVTDIEGNYALEISDGATLVFSSVGYVKESVQVSGRSTIDLTMQPDVTQLEELVVIGYGTTQERELTSAISTVDSDEIVKTPNSNAMQALQGKVAGVNITSSGAPGASPNVRIRGLGTFSTAGGAGGPLYVVDGMFVDDIDFLNPADIAEVSVLKDAAASAIYGVRASNGVVIIETKTGKYNEGVEISYSGYYGAQVAQNVIKMSNTAQYANYVEATGIPEEQVLIENAINRFGRSRVNPNLPVTNTDWYNEVLTNSSPIQNHTLNISGGTDKARYSVGASYFEQQGLMDHMRNDYERVNFRAQVDAEAAEWLTVGGNAILSNATQYNADFGVWFQTYFAVPTLPVFDPFNITADPTSYGNAQLIDYRSSQNPFFTLENNDNRNNIGKILGNFYADFKIIPDKLTFNTSFNYFYGTTLERNVDFAYNDGVSEEQNGLTRRSSTDFNTIWDNILTYKDSFGPNNLTVTAGYSFRSEINEGVQARGVRIRTISRDDESTWYIPDNSELNPDNTFDFGQRVFGSSYFGRISYDYQRKYLVSASFRRDGTNKFTEKWGNFFTVSGGWVLSEENFFDVDFVDFLKLRAGWGQMGDDGIAPAIGQTTFEQIGVVIGNELVTGVRPDNVFDLINVWETTEEINVGLSALFLESRLSLEADVFQRDTEDAVLNVFQRGTGESPRRNAGSIRNQGIELALGWSDQVNPNFSYNISANYTILENEVLSVGDQPFLDDGSAEFRQRSAVGSSIREFFGYEIIGVFQTEEEVSNSGYSDDFIANNNLEPGDFYFRDQNDDGIINAEDRVFLGTYLPTYLYGANFGINYGGLSLSVYVQGQGGNKILNRKRGEIIFTQDTNIDADLATNFWDGPGSTDKYPSAKGYRKAYNNNQLNEFLLEDGDYFRIQNINLSYTFSEASISGIELPETMITLTAERPVTIFDYNGFNPEVADGIDRQTYPIPAIYTLGLNVNF